MNWINTFFKTCTLVVIVILSSCASLYVPINPPKNNFPVADSSNALVFSYQYDLLDHRWNGNYTENQDKNGLQIITVKMVNQTDSTLIFGTDLNLYSNGEILTLLSPQEIHKSIRQCVECYIPPLAICTPIVFLGVDPLPIIGGIVPSIIATNMVTAIAANKIMLGEMIRYDIQNKAIQPSDTVYGIVGVRKSTFDPIYLKRIERD